MRRESSISKIEANQLEGVDYNSLREGQQVEFEVGQGRNGQPLAVKVRLISIKKMNLSQRLR